jgi:hypothetical protein
MRGPRLLSKKARRCTGPDDLQRRANIKTGAARMGETFACTYRVAGDGDLVCHFRMLTGSRAAHMHDVAAHQAQNCAHTLKCRSVAADLAGFRA